MTRAVVVRVGERRLSDGHGVTRMRREHSVVVPLSAEKRKDSDERNRYSDVQCKSASTQGFPSPVAYPALSNEALASHAESIGP
jgi:hypothetical protein